ncbi:MAG TPA: enoyl-CoA hydratase-related protein [Clostridia bacterium]|nr:enoyl-CoA hydratase-related protein [Clostridia bacterium]
MEEYNNILYKVEENIAFITLNRPKALNALNTETLDDLGWAVLRAGKEKEVKAVIITGEGRAFVAGADIAEMRGLTIQEGRDMTILGQEVFNRIENLDKPVIAAVNGFALGGGCELAMACDIRVASDKAKFGQPEVNLGIIPGFGGTQRLPRLVGKGAAKYLIFTGEMISAEEAFRLGLVDKVVPGEELLSTAVSIAKVIMSKAPVAIKMAKHAIKNGMNVDLKSGIAYEAEAYTTSFGTEDRIEGMSAFVEKRSAEFKNK